MGWPEPYIYGVYTVFLAGKSPNIWSYGVYTVLANPTYINGSGQPYLWPIFGEPNINGTDLGSCSLPISAAREAGKTKPHSKQARQNPIQTPSTLTWIPSGLPLWRYAGWASKKMKPPRLFTTWSSLTDAHLNTDHPLAYLAGVKQGGLVEREDLQTFLPSRLTQPHWSSLVLPWALIALWLVSLSFQANSAC